MRALAESGSRPSSLRGERARGASPLLHAALAELDAHERRFRSRRDLQELAASVSDLLRRVAQQRFEPRRVASLYGETWLEFLTTTGLPPEVAESIELAFYAGDALAPSPGGGGSWLGPVRAWVRRHA